MHRYFRVKHLEKSSRRRELSMLWQLRTQHSYVEDKTFPYGIILAQPVPAPPDLNSVGCEITMTVVFVSAALRYIRKRVHESSFFDWLNDEVQGTEQSSWSHVRLFVRYQYSPEAAKQRIEKIVARAKIEQIKLGLGCKPYVDRHRDGTDTVGQLRSLLPDFEVHVQILLDHGLCIFRRLSASYRPVYQGRKTVGLPDSAQLMTFCPLPVTEEQTQATCQLKWADSDGNCYIPPTENDKTVYTPLSTATSDSDNFNAGINWPDKLTDTLNKTTTTASGLNTQESEQMRIPSSVQHYDHQSHGSLGGNSNNGNNLRSEPQMKNQELLRRPYTSSELGRYSRHSDASSLSQTFSYEPMNPVPATFPRDEASEARDQTNLTFQYPDSNNLNGETSHSSTPASPALGSLSCESDTY
ncbi:hypothetical protein SBOR_8781 [Sclerotinia borealis F-4128]|uniref:Uncharacterized protein n=1 Tax=Sclerotinia borealis (strain F-4128) TaxID=1432307 RepID=W9C4Q2_SCLBF|nr:hypothetical protein SBOR_8781 [Sclerotinia borealis F-4128]